MKKIFFLSLLACAICIGVSCSNNDADEQPPTTEEVVPGKNHKMLIAYFSEPLSDGVDASTSASRLVANGTVYGSVEYLAHLIQTETDADMVRIQTAQAYPNNFDDLAEQANQERQNDVHPALATNIENFDDYDIVFVGYPIWWYQMPMAMYSFFEKYDFRGKTIIPFSSHGGSGWSGSLNVITNLEPNATMATGLSVSRNNVAGSADNVHSWLQGLNLLENKQK